MNALVISARSHAQEALGAEVDGSAGLLEPPLRFPPEAPIFPALVVEQAPEPVPETVGIRLACSRIVRWQHGGINE